MRFSHGKVTQISKPNYIIGLKFLRRSGKFASSCRTPPGGGGVSLQSKDYKRFWGFSKDYKQKENFRGLFKDLRGFLKILVMASAAGALN